MSEARSIKLCDDIYNILGVCTNEEITPIVELLINSPTSVLGITRAFERHAPDHQQYIDQIGDEIYRLAVDALSCRDGTRPTYSAMLEGINKQIGLPVVVGDVGVNEANLLNVFVSQHLLSVPVDDRHAIVGEASGAASRATSG